MKKVKEVLRLRSLGLHQHQIARSCAIGQSTVHHYLKRAAAAGIDWALAEQTDDAELERRLFPPPPAPAPPPWAPRKSRARWGMSSGLSRSGARAI